MPRNPPSAGPAADRPGLALKQAQAALRSHMDAALRDLGLTTPQYACLEALVQVPGISIAELARRTFVTRQAAHQVLGVLVREDLARREPDAGGRAVPVRATAEGERRAYAARTAVDAVEAAMVSTLTTADRRRLVELLRACADGLGHDD